MKTVVAALIKKDGQYLLAKRASGVENIGLWEFPGGKVEKGETDEEALKREIIEEFNTVVSVGKCVAKASIDNERKLKLYACEHVLGSY